MDPQGYGLPIYPSFTPYVIVACLRDPSRSTSPGVEGHRFAKSVKNGSAQNNKNLCLDVALRNLNQAVSASLKTYQAFLEGLESQTKLLEDWAEEFTLGTIWRSKARNKLRGKRDKEIFDAVAERISNCKAGIVDAVPGAQRISPPPVDDKYRLDRLIRTAKKALLCCDVIIPLAGRAVNERIACLQLVHELEEAEGPLSRQSTHGSSKAVDVDLINR
ncbi:hypothetical protein B0T22DRAFT_533994 [Podospora appendiculata]|uniref:Uncharacterized protein n=1 Tax=Podospora appendiculata TaxID=314037 RepID=A0AAE0XLB6_9PEZI|nr:hypothetical protein B0T22DRAFT_533994 [Podospora appendiculata]